MAEIQRWSAVIAGVTGSRSALAREKNGTLHVISRAGAAECQHTTIDASGAPSGVVSAIPGSGGQGAHGPWLLATSDGSLLQAIFGGQDGSLHMTASKDGGTIWEAPVTLAGTGEPQQMDAAGDAEARPYVLSGAAGRLNLVANDSATAEVVYEAALCCTGRVALALDAESAEGWAAWRQTSPRSAALMAKAVKPSTGKALAAPGARRDDGSPLALAARLGAPGVYLAYAAGQPVAREVKLWNVRGGEALTVAQAAGVSRVVLTAAPDGRLWIVWRTANLALAAVRSDMALTRFSRPYGIGRPAPGAGGAELAADAGAGPLDVIAGGFHTRVYPQLTVTAEAAGIRVTDVGDPVEGAAVEIEGKALKTDAKGLAAYPLAKGAVAPKVAVSMKGYAPATLAASPAAAAPRAK